MITHNSNLDRLLDIDHVIFPKMNITIHEVNERGSKQHLKHKFQTKVVVKGRNGDNYYVPVIKDFYSLIGDADNPSFEKLHGFFKDACEVVRDHFIATEGKDVLITDYLKIKHLSADEITKEA
jgi:hypothetical protein